MTYNIFGSENSLDYDIMVFVEDIPSIVMCKKLCKEYEEELSKVFTDKPIDVNLAVVKDDMIVDVYKGFPAECNDMIYWTYKRHIKHQRHMKMVTKEVGLTEDYIQTKVARTVRILLSSLSRTKYRPMIKKALKGTFMDQLCILQMIRLEGIYSLHDKHSNEDVRKNLAFQIGQCLGVLEGMQLFSKSSIGAHYCVLNPYLERETEGIDNSGLDMEINMLCRYIFYKFGEKVFEIKKQ